LLILAPDGRDGSVLSALLADAGIGAQIDATGDALVRALESGAAAGAIITDEGLTRIGVNELRKATERQPTWSDFPFIVLTRRSDRGRSNLLGIEQTLNATLLERPLHPASLVSAARSAIRSRDRQRLAARHLEQLESARAELRALAQSLESKVRERTRELASANDRLTAEIAERERAEERLVQAQKMEALGQLTGGIAHDFNNLLTAVIGSLDLLIKRSDDERTLRLARNALHAAERGGTLTAQLLAFSRRQRLSPVAIDVNYIISSMGDLLARSLGPRIRLETVLDPALWPALADRTQLEMMILNLAINARDAMPSGGTLRISTSNASDVPDDLSSELKPGEYVSIAVSDSGVGMNQSVLAKAFEPFFTTKEAGKGTGLGLSQLYGFAQQSGGTAKIDSQENQGTTVRIYLPRTIAMPHRAGETSTAPDQVRRARVLLVDDDDDVRGATEAMIEELGYAVSSFNRGQDAIKALQRERFDLLITDIMMPGMNGAEVARLARKGGLDKVLFASGYADIEEFGEELDNALLVRKPFRMADLAASIQAALSGAKPERAKVVDLAEARRDRGD